VDDAPEIDGNDYALEVSGCVADKQSWTLAKLRTLQQVSQINRLICIEGWSAIGQWSGVPLRVFLERIGADLNDGQRIKRFDEKQPTGARLGQVGE
jgi:DMSO/TMAO reductase YedYZ molybdopterin-dependent catalytic subunit